MDSVILSFCFWSATPVFSCNLWLFVSVPSESTSLHLQFTVVLTDRQSYNLLRMLARLECETSWRGTSEVRVLCLAWTAEEVSFVCFVHRLVHVHHEHSHWASAVSIHIQQVLTGLLLLAGPWRDTCAAASCNG